tara:strand:- start:12904 stop:13311 length:408 start_codon:yes stop_codon:yes gene_type:complete
MKAILIRLSNEKKQTLGSLQIFDGTNKIFECHTLELANKDNQRSVSRIPEGTYKCVARISDKYSRHFHVTKVDDRSLILIHAGNYHTHTRGCILVGKSLLDINGDGYRDVTNSKTTMNELNSLNMDSFDLTVISL